MRTPSLIKSTPFPLTIGKSKENGVDSVPWLETVTLNLLDGFTIQRFCFSDMISPKKIDIC